MDGVRTPRAHEHLTRHARQLMLPGYDLATQGRLQDARVLVVGAGGLGCTVLPQLAASGVGTIGVVDDDVVEPSNLARQTLYGPRDVGAAKVDVAVARLTALAPDARLVAHRSRLDATTVSSLVAEYDVVVDGSDNFATRYLVDDAVAARGRPLVWGAVHQYAGQCGVAWAPCHPTYRDLFPREPAPGEVPSCAEAGVLPGVCAVVGALLATETVKVLTGIGEPLLGRVLLYDARGPKVQELAFRAGERRRGLSASAGAPSTSPPSSAAASSAAASSAAASSAAPATRGPRELAARLGEDPAPDLVDVREDWEVALAAIPGARHIPLRELPARIGEIPTDRDVVVVCHHGVRSEQAASLLIASGLSRVSHLGGGVDAWSRDVDPGVRRY